jgi:hypothetical protein
MAVVGLLDQRIAEAEFDQEVANDSPHGGEVVHHQDFHVLVQTLFSESK